MSKKESITRALIIITTTIVGILIPQIIQLSILLILISISWEIIDIYEDYKKNIHKP